MLPGPEEAKARLQALRAAFDAEDQRRKGLTPEERLKEDGVRLCQSLKSRPNALLTLQPTPRPTARWARCRALDCLYGSSSGGLYGAEIRHKYRICHKLGGGPYLEYCHVRCMESMVPLLDLMGSQFQLDRKAEWSLMIGKWMEHRGEINLEKIAAYIHRSTTLMDAIGTISCIRIEHSAFCIARNARHSLYACPSFPRGHKVPVLKDYTTTGDEACGLWDVLCHPYATSSIAFFEDEDPP